MRRTPVRMLVAGGWPPASSHRLLSGFLMHVSRKRLDVFDRRRRQNPVTEVEDVAEASARAREHVVGGGEGAIEWAEQQRRIKIALNRAVRSDPLPRFVQRDPP